MTTGERIKAARIAAGMTQTELAEKVGLKFSAIHKYETGIVVNLKRETIAALSSALHVKPTWLMCMDDEAEENEELSAQQQEIKEIFDRLSPAGRAQAVAVLRALAQAQPDPGDPEGSA